MERCELTCLQCSDGEQCICQACGICCGDPCGSGNCWYVEDGRRSLPTLVLIYAYIAKHGLLGMSTRTGTHKHFSVRGPARPGLACVGWDFLSSVSRPIGHRMTRFAWVTCWRRCLRSLELSLPLFENQPISNVSPNQLKFDGTVCLLVGSLVFTNTWDRNS